MKHCYKAVRADNHKSWYDNETFWEPGKIVEVKDYDPRPYFECGRGIHCSKKLLDAVSYQWGSSDYFIVKPINIINESEDKLRCEAVLVMRKLEKQSVNRIAQFNLWEANHPINPLLVERENILYKKHLKDWASVRTSVFDSVRASVFDSVWASVWANVLDSVRASVLPSVFDSVLDSVFDSVRASVFDSVWAYIGGLFTEIKQWKYIDKEDPWKPLLKLWYAGYLPSFDGETWRLHVGKDAEIFYEWRP